MAENYQNGLKTLWEKDKLLVTSNFSFSLSLSKNLVTQGRQKVSLCGNRLTFKQTTRSTRSKASAEDKFEIGKNEVKSF